MTRRSFFRTFAATIAATAIAQRVVGSWVKEHLAPVEQAMTWAVDLAVPGSNQSFRYVFNGFEMVEAESPPQQTEPNPDYVTAVPVSIRYERCDGKFVRV